METQYYVEDTNGYRQSEFVSLFTAKWIVQKLTIKTGGTYHIRQTRTGWLVS